MSIFLILLVLGAIISIILLSIGGVLLFKKMKYDKSVTADITKVICQDGTNKCNITMSFKDAEKSYTVAAIVSGPVTEGSTRGIIYDSSNPNNFYPGQPPVRIIGAGMFVSGLVLALGCIVGAYFMYRKPSAAPAAPSAPLSSVPQAPSSLNPSLPHPGPSGYSESATPMPSDPATVRAKQYADDMVSRVTEPARRDLF
jgi:hypothetical protein